MSFYHHEYRASLVSLQGKLLCIPGRMKNHARVRGKRRWRSEFRVPHPIEMCYHIKDIGLWEGYWESTHTSKGLNKGHSSETSALETLVSCTKFPRALAQGGVGSCRGSVALDRLRLPSGWVTLGKPGPLAGPRFFQL